MICSGNNCHKYERRISDADKDVNYFPHERFANFALLERSPKHARMVNHGAADDEGVAEMHAGHRGKRIHIIPAHPNAGGVVVTDGVKEAIFLREQARRHAGVECECEEGEEVGEGERSANRGKGFVRRGDVVVPSNKTAKVLICV